LKLGSERTGTWRLVYEIGELCNVVGVFVKIDLSCAPGVDCAGIMDVAAKLCSINVSIGFDSVDCSPTAYLI